MLSTKRLEELAALDWDTRRSAWADLDDEVELPDRNAGKILTLHDLLAMVRDWHRPVQVAIETKHPVRYSGRVEQRLVQSGGTHHRPPLSRAGTSRAVDLTLESGVLRGRGREA